MREWETGGRRKGRRVGRGREGEVRRKWEDPQSARDPPGTLELYAPECQNVKG